ncbi:DNA polymerase alpha/epsilon subunit B-domain-containing protein [Halteromyces radiatus]|uniref:DNA polymerase alpha/epsilon subunit B-domain-containing protein n=1 Tax=Halteromyces radiatus TaxID=101107 RepID=UPI002220BB2A|nr:DNA polymerase alpha/epsilon subunit B-domain-containing protein [Halteromyces radiatus]KAI8093585.1 DNA polymerase alpha/epsilon subunit B-domain-containing protein [Halteromyces radiatus]
MATIPILATTFELDQKEHSQVLLELESLCRLYSLSPEDLKFKWEAFSFNKKNAQVPTVDLVRQLKSTIQHKFEQTLQQQPSQSQRSRPSMKQQQPALNFSEYMDVDAAQDPVDDFLSKLTSGGGTDIYPKKNVPGTRGDNKNLATIPSTLDIEQSQPTTRFLDRSQMNTIESQYNPQLSVRDKNVSVAKATIQSVQPPIQKYRYMFEKIRNRAEVLDDRIDYIAGVINEAFGLEDGFGNPSRMTQGTITAVGRICCDAAEGKLNDKSILLETSRSLGMGKRVKLDISKVNEYSLFPGQIIAVEGKNTTGKSFSVDKILMPPLPDSIEKQTSTNEITQVIVAAGPYTLDSDFSFMPLDDLLSVCQEEQADVVILMGPFISTAHPLIAKGQVDQLPEDIFRTQIATKLNHFAQSNPGTQILIMPHAHDIFQEWPLFPQPGLSLSSLHVTASSIQSISNPSIFEINGSIFAIGNVDILRSIGIQEINKNVPIERLLNLSRHVLQQQNFYPLFPASPGDSIDADQMAHLQLSTKPDFLILPSHLRQFAKLLDDDDVLCINPGHLCKGRSSGTFAKLIIHPSMDESKTSDRTRIDLVRL